MKWVSTRASRSSGKAAGIPISQALARGLAPDGGLYVPERFPRFDLKTFDGKESLAEIAALVLDPFFDGDILEKSLREICERAFSFVVPLEELREGTSVLELFHGPTAAFKDFGARFLAECLQRLSSLAGATTTILVATSGDTGGAVAAAFDGRPGFQVYVLFPKGAVSARQQKQLTCWGETIRAYSVRGSFDDCQKLVKAALSDANLAAKLHLSSANSINVGRVLPQMAYYAAASLWYWRRHAKRPSFAIPTGNLGNALGALWAKRCGFPIEKIGLATNANRPIPDYLQSGKWEPRPSIATLANAMDVGNPSNMERVFALYAGVEELRKDVVTLSLDDQGIRDIIHRGPRDWNRIWCPHTATAVALREAQKSGDWIVVATAHPAKFETIVEPLIGGPVEIPPALADVLSRPTRCGEIGPDFEEFRRILR